MRTIIFDFDGTLVDSLRIVVEIGQQLVKIDKEIDDTDLIKFRGMGPIKVADHIGIKKYQWPFLLFRGRRMMTKKLAELEPFEGTKELLAELSDRGYQLLIVSSNSKTNIDKFLRQHQLSSYFNKTYGGIGLFSKASALKSVIKRNNLNIDQVIYVGDEPRDVVAAKQCHIPCVAVSWGFSNTDALNRYKPTIMAQNRSQLLDQIISWAEKPEGTT